MADVVRIKNVGETDFIGGFEQTRWVVKAGQESVVPWHAARHWTGRWDYVDKDRHQERTTEYERLMVLYGIFDDEDTKAFEKMETNIPKLEVYDIDGDRILTVLDDPKGDALMPTDQTRAEKALIEDQVADLKRQLASLTSALAQKETSEHYEPSVEEVPADKPTKVPVTDGPRRGRTASGS